MLALPTSGCQGVQIHTISCIRLAPKSALCPISYNTFNTLSKTARQVHFTPVRAASDTAVDMAAVLPKSVHGSKLAIALVGPGLIGATLLDQIAEQAATLRQQQGLSLDIAAIAGSRKLHLRDANKPLQGWRDAYAAESAPLDHNKLAQHLLSFRPSASPVVIDCTSSEATSDRYAEWLAAGIHVITPNKKLNSGPLPRYRDALNAAANSGAWYLSECTVGAGLPVLSTLKSLIETGDELQKVEGIFSGTLSYIFNTFGPQTPFSAVVQKAKEAGYTEPDPRDDLNGSDVGRKVLTLARVAGAELELADVAIESLVPGPLQSVATAEEYMSRLPEFDGDMAKQAADADAAGEVVRFVGLYDATSRKASAKLARYRKTHPFAQLSGSDNMIVFTTKRYNSQPLIVRGPGAGAEVTAAGVFGDLVMLAKALAVAR